jgi:ribonuclease III
MTRNSISEFEKTIEYRFKNQDYIKQALVHRSYINEHPGFSLGHNERLEFLGDAVLELIVTEYLFATYSDSSEGELTNWRAALVNTRSLSEVAGKIAINDYIYLSHGESKDDNSKARQIILANAVESTIGALYLDGGMTVAKKFIDTYFISKLPYILEHQLHIDPKSNLQEKLQETKGITPNYRVLSEKGPDHDKIFVVGVFMGKEQIGRGEGSSKQHAQEEAAKNALEINIE